MKRSIHGGERRWEPAEDDRAWLVGFYQNQEPLDHVVERLVRPTPPRRRWYDGCWWVLLLSLAADAAVQWAVIALLKGWWP